MFPMALVCGNTSVMKPSERDPGATMILAELAVEAGFPAGTVNIIHGQHDGKTIIISQLSYYALAS